jgi:hypothetical protein
MDALRTHCRRFGMLASAAVISLFVAHGCGNDDGGTANGVSLPCSEACARCPTEGRLCSDCAFYAGRLRDEFEGSLYNCVVGDADAGACLRAWDRCVFDAIGVAGERDLDRSFRGDCLARRTECQNEMKGFSDDACFISGAFVESSVVQARECFAKPCGEITDCLMVAF